MRRWENNVNNATKLNEYIARSQTKKKETKTKWNEMRMQKSLASDEQKKKIPKPIFIVHSFSFSGCCVLSFHFHFVSQLFGCIEMKSCVCTQNCLPVLLPSYAIVYHFQWILFLDCGCMRLRSYLKIGKLFMHIHRIFGAI